MGLLYGRRAGGSVLNSGGQNFLKGGVGSWFSPARLGQTRVREAGRPSWLSPQGPMATAALRPQTCQGIWVVKGLSGCFGAGGAQGHATHRACLTTSFACGCGTPASAPCAWPLTGWPLRTCWARPPTMARASSCCATGLSCLQFSTCYLPPAMCQGSPFQVVSRRYALRPALSKLSLGSWRGGPG